MATKKQKRLAALAKRERYLAAERKVGLEALEKDRARRERRLADAKKEAEKRKASETTHLLNVIFGPAENQGDNSPIDLTRTQ